ncbi:DUF7168 domain-containing protein [Microvirgula aerodenitrificans]|uniref:DUF7168 domain-containing protein n=1 Tax=Microvirgula aerodenitrificans TaxID=57480 RepID=UPI00248EBC16|nr:DUF2786 domain-containing protein [Microvirgula aerodenitrificans]
MDKKSAIEKIEKCLALSKSANENEAAAALRQARALMEKFNVSDLEMLASDVSESSAKSGAKRTPATWENTLARSVGDAFGCELIFATGWASGCWRFIGCGAAPDIAQYAFTVLLRQVKKERAAFTKLECKRLKPANKTRRADLFCDAWVSAVARQVREFAGMPVNRAAIDAYMGQRYSNCKDLEARDRNNGRNLRDKDFDALDAGSRSGRNAQLNHGVSTQPLALR